MKIKLFLFIIGVFCIHTLKAQSKLIFSYDASGNQNQRYYCTSTNCTPPPPPPIAPLEEETTQLKPTEETIQRGTSIFTIYPNPTDGYITVSVDSEHKGLNMIQVYDVTGRLIMNKKVEVNTQSTLLDIKKYPAGIYLMRFVHGNGHIVSKKIIKH